MKEREKEEKTPNKTERTLETVGKYAQKKLNLRLSALRQNVINQSWGLFLKDD